MSDTSASKHTNENPGSLPPLKRIKLAESTPSAGENNALEPMLVGEPSSSQTQGKDADKKKNKRRGGWRRGTRNKEEEEAKAKDEIERPKALRYPKRQCALLIGFCGSGYSGMQIQPGEVKTIEGVLFKALVKIGAVSQDNADDPVKVSLARAARTDAGVHAAGNLVSMKIIITIPGIKDIVARINEELPPEIRVWGYTRVQNSFNARLVCESRKYTYYFPSYLLIPPKPDSGLQRKLRQHAESSNVSAEINNLEDFWKGDLSETRSEELIRKRAWRVKPETMARLRLIAAKYEGSHNFHNFTVGRDFRDKSSQRFMKKIEIADPVVYGDTEWISILLHGQSFMLHQRKMMTALILSCRCGTPIDVIDHLYRKPDVFIPKMPALGLLLEEPLFENYNRKVASVNEKFKPTDPDYRPPIDFEMYRDKMEAFKQEFIYTNMREVESKDGIFDAWMRTIDSYAGNDLLYLGSTGTLPEACIIEKGVRRENPFKERRFFDATSFPENGGVKLSIEEEEVSEDEDVVKMDKKLLAETEG